MDVLDATSFRNIGPFRTSARVTEIAVPETPARDHLYTIFSRNEERGVFRTRDGGTTWSRVLYVDDGIGAIDLAINRKSPGILYAAVYEKHRTPWQLALGGGRSGPAGGRGRGAGPVLPAGDYRITVEVAGQQQTTVGRIRERVWTSWAARP